MIRSLYVAERDHAVWERAKALAAEKGTSLSALVVTALQDTIDAADAARSVK